MFHDGFIVYGHWTWAFVVKPLKLLLCHYSIINPDHVVLCLFTVLAILLSIKRGIERA